MPNPKEVCAAYRTARKLALHAARCCPRSLPKVARVLVLFRREYRKAKIRERYVRVNISKEDQALAVLAAHPEWSNAKIAREIRTPRTYLPRMKRFMDARKVLKEGRERFRGVSTV
jgi:hypothetical protein